MLLHKLPALSSQHCKYPAALSQPSRGHPAPAARRASHSSRSSALHGPAGAEQPGTDLSPAAPATTFPCIQRRRDADKKDNEKEGGSSSCLCCLFHRMFSGSQVISCTASRAESITAGSVRPSSELGGVRDNVKHIKKKTAMAWVTYRLPDLPHILTVAFLAENHKAILQDTQLQF